ncbi:ATP-binding protein [Pararhodobacter sp. CCB-MM2]|uniref:ATP-binding protein n=1 Tax=Pararhodobacter sp. CCB-MM2 TaxID=1786003 RepID=UPI00082963E5|nr:ATP-binding protein [Pararhodobacter sp. CCB-MM2]
MKKLIFESLELLSLKERRARRISFHPKMTVITGENDVGKSSVIKSIFWTLGAEAAKVHPNWVEANIKSLLTFTVDDVRYRALRERNGFSFFTDDGKLLIRANSVVKELAPFMAELLDFQLVLSNRVGEPEIPPPAYAFLPFYIDQDSGWAKPLESFANLTQYSAYKKPIIEFHTGIRPNEFYVLEAAKRQIQVKQREFQADRNVVQKAMEKVGLTETFDGLELSTEGHEVAVERLLVRLKQLREDRRTRAAKLAEILDQRVVTENQIATVRAALREIEKDIVFARDLPEEIFCPVDFHPELTRVFHREVTHLGLC